jgi:glutaminase
MESPIDSYLRQIHAEIAKLKDGKPYSTIPAMANVDPNNFGIALATVDGEVYEVGDTREEFTIQSISKPFTYGLALEDLGYEAVDAKVDVEPSGDSFNEISLAEGSGRPANAMINAGALTATSLIKGSGGQSGFKRILSTYSAFAGRQLSVSEKVFESELKHGHRNTALAHLLRSFNIIEDDPVPVLEDYFRQCSVLVNSFDLSIMAATLANGGRNPLSGKQVLEIGPVERVLSVMMTSGMYDDAGAWISSVGMPGKSGVAGGIIAVLPGQVGLAVYSPPLDEHGSSVRGLATAQRLSRDMELHFVRAARAGRSAILAAYDVTETPSGIRRNDEAADVLRQHGHRARVIELNGDLLFAGTESMVRELSALEDGVEVVILDLRRTDQVSAVALRMLEKAREGMAETGRELVLVEADGSVAEALGQSPGQTEGALASFASRSAAVEYCENRLLERYGNRLLLPAKVPVSASPALAPLEEADALAVQALMTAKKYDDGEVIRRVGLRFGGVYFITSGKVSSTSPGPSGDRVKLNTLSAGMTFGELALGSGNRQETTVRAVGPVEVMVLTAEAISELEAANPLLAIALWKALTRDAYTRVEQYLRESVVRIRN